MYRYAVYCLILTASALLSVGCHGSGSKPVGNAGDTSPTHVRVRKALSVKRAATVMASGSVEAREISNVAFQVPGKVGRVLVEEGASVRQGQLLAELTRPITNTHCKPPRDRWAWPKRHP